MEPTAIETILADDRFVRALARRLVRDEATADDVAQAAYVEALGRRPDSSSPRGWVATVVRHVASNLRRGEVRRARHELAASRAEEQAPESLLAEREEIRQRLVAAVMQLGRPRSSVVILRYFDDLPPRAIAARLGMPVETVRTHLKRAHAELRTRLGDDRRGDGSSFLAALPLLFPAARLEPAAVGVALMTVKSKIALVVLAVAIATITWLAVRPDERVEPLAGEARAEPVALAETAPAPGAIEAPVEPTERAALEAIVGALPPPATTASDVVLLRGVVLDADGGPIPGVLVEGGPDAAMRELDEPSLLARLVGALGAPREDAVLPEGRFHARSRADGSFEVRGIPPRDAYAVAATSADHGVVVVTGVPVRADEPANVTLRFERGVVLRGRVTNEVGGSVGEAHVQVMGSRDDKQYSGLLYVTAAADGSWRTPPLARSGFNVSADAKGFQNQHRTLRWDRRDEREIVADFQLTPAQALRGRFVDERGAPARLADALAQRGIEAARGRLALFGSYDDPSGNASFRDLGHDEGTIAWDEDRWELVPDDAGPQYVSLWCGSTLLGHARAAASGETDVVVHVDRLPNERDRRAISVRVVDEEQRAVEGATAKLWAAFDQSGGMEMRVRTFEAAGATLRLDDVLPAVYEVRATAPGFVARRVPLVVGAGTAPIEVEVVLSRAGRGVTIVARDARGAPVEGVRLFVLDAQGEVVDVAGTQATNLEGRKRIENLGAGELTIVASHERYGAAGVRAPAGDADVELAIELHDAIDVRVDAGPGYGPFAFRVLDAAGTVVRDDACIASRSFGAGFTLRLAPGRHTVVVRSPGFVAGSKTIDVVPGASVAVELAPLAR